ncbi:P-loop ATPase, Sll1717 family [Maribacter sp. 1_2014MBL_MicDiv]|uniref:P-loop ATPase, Sll1717 family n=1 Tax=Maribacter sp. 1_2014MBL_MicDiv TaxID=1644130 RepID=UPI0008F4EA6B|nr:ATPase [Maribacter sp. 1_2014MBL_MicDiv]APA65859.1 ATPase [Maribacter sp. 1_2014MBL_MicDiv]
MNILDWIDIGKVSAERDDLLSKYFYDAGVLNSVIQNSDSFLVLGRKGAGKTAVFKYLSENKAEFIPDEDILISLSFEDYNWNIHSLLVDPGKAESLAFKQSWKFVILVECIKAYHKWYEDSNITIPKKLSSTKKLLEKLFDSPIPSIGKIIGKKLLSLSKFSLPKAGLDLENGNFDSAELGGGEVSFEDVKNDDNLQGILTNNIENVITILEDSLFNLDSSCPIIYLCFDRVDESWDEVSYTASKPVITGLISASDTISSQYKNKIRPVVFLREDIFEVLEINDSNKLREDCGELLHWNRTSLNNLILRRLNFYASSKDVNSITDIDGLFDKKEMRQRTRPTNYILKRTMMRPRDFIAYMGKIIRVMKDKQNDPFSDEINEFENLEISAIYDAEPSYSDWLRQEILDEWKVQNPIIKDLFNSLRNNGFTNFTAEELQEQMKSQHPTIRIEQVNDYLRFLFDNSIVGFKLGASKEWRFKCFYPSQGFVVSDEYRVHEGLVRSLNLKETREK